VVRTRVVAIAGLAAALLLSACGSGSQRVSARDENTTTSQEPATTTATSEPTSSTAQTTSSGPTSTTRVPLSGFKLVDYGGLRFQVPAAWPVYDLAKDPARCVRFDQHAVYLGHAGTNQDCPSQLVGRTDAVQVEPIDAVSQTTTARAQTPGIVNGLSVRQDPSSAITRSLIAAFDSVGNVATVTFADNDALAQKILGTFERAG
jgi:hypothetical protein